MKLLLLADKESRYLWDFYKPGCLREYDLMLSCGDLKAEYLTFLATLGRSPLLYVRGNHDDNYESRPPEGCECIEDKLVTVGGLRIVGLGGSPLYSGGRNQYTERQMEARIRKQRQEGLKAAVGKVLRVAEAARAASISCLRTPRPAASATRRTLPTAALRPSCRCSTAISRAI